MVTRGVEIAAISAVGGVVGSVVGSVVGIAVAVLVIVGDACNVDDGSGVSALTVGKVPLPLVAIARFDSAG